MRPIYWNRWIQFNFMNGYQFIFSVYSVLMLGGGFMGYKKAKSTASLVMGIISAVAIGAGVFCTFSNAVLGYLIIAVMSSVLTVTFLIRFLKTKKMMPAGMLLILSALASALSIYLLSVN